MARSGQVLAVPQFRKEAALGRIAAFKLSPSGLPLQPLTLSWRLLGLVRSGRPRPMDLRDEAP